MPAAKKKQVTTKKKNNNVVAQVQGPKRVASANMPQCAIDYALAISDPFADLRSMPCVPLFPLTPSKKIKVTAAGSITTGATAYGGFIYGDALSGAADGVTSFWYTDNATGGAYAGTAFAASGAGITSGTTTGGQVAGSYFSRVVSYGIRVMYEGTAQDCGGTIRLLHTADHTSLTGIGVANIASFDESTTLSLDCNKWYEIGWKPLLSTSLDIMALPTSNFAANVGIYLKPATANATFRFEIVGYYEVYGRYLKDLTSSPSAANATEAILSVASTKEHIQANVTPATEERKTRAQRFKEFLVHAAGVVKDVLGVAIPIAQTVAKML